MSRKSIKIGNNPRFIGVTKRINTMVEALIWATTETPRGIRNNNPGNLATNPKLKWRGELEPDSMYCTFDTPLNGLRAMAITLRAYYAIHCLHNIVEIITRYAPPATNDTQAYIDDVALQTGRDPREDLNIPRDISALSALMRAIVTHENGEYPYPVTAIDAAITAAGIT